VNGLDGKGGGGGGGGGRYQSTRNGNGANGGSGIVVKKYNHNELLFTEEYPLKRLCSINMIFGIFLLM